jgi:glycosyltransferase involved in cell wall biosynthesis
MTNVALIHPFDPRGNKVGGLETYTRDFIRFHPADFDILMIGVDGRGDLELGRVVDLDVQGRTIKFLPIIHYSDKEIHKAANRLSKSITFNFFVGILKNWMRLRRILKSGRYSVDLRRVEFSPFCYLNGIPFIQMLHGEGAPKLKMDSLLSKYRAVHNLNQSFAVRFCKRFLCVNPFITERIKSEYPSYSSKISTLTTWYKPDVYAPSPFRDREGNFKIVFCGRLDLFKVPSLMFRAISKLEKKIPGKVEFHYIGTSDPKRFEEFKLIERFTTLHGFQEAVGIAKILEEMHCGILTSEFEGMPRFVLETLGAGRPTVAVHLPQLEAVIKEGVSGYLIERSDDIDHLDDLVSHRLADIRTMIARNEIQPDNVAFEVRDFTPSNLLGRVYSYHKEIEHI